ncbi:MAG: tRNA lysidine(34) synthetase TilS [Spirochaetes bacterium]|nr:tRNA lysidine(34) synthetase TilS [Spirochaetota bacterium]
MDPLLTKVAEFIDREKLIGKKDRVLLSLSAGKDSMFLFHALRAIGETAGFYTGIFHLNHMSRGQESDLDEEMVVRLAGENNIEIHVERAAVTEGPSFEERARNLRYRLLEEIAGRYGFNVIATAHHRDDTIETILMRIFSGTGVYGLRGIPSRRGNIVRPLLELSSKVIRDHLEEQCIPWREDASNCDVTYNRNFLRHVIIPMIVERFPMAPDAVIALSATARESALLLDDLVTRCYPDIIQHSGDETWVDTFPILHCRPLFNHVLASALRRGPGKRVTRSILDEVYHSYLGRKAHAELYRDGSIRIVGGMKNGRRGLRITPLDFNQALPPPWEYPLDTDNEGRCYADITETGLRIAIERVDRPFFEQYKKNSRYAFLRLDECPGTLYIRNRRNGDRILTERGSKKIKDLLIELKLDERAKSRVPLLVSNGTVIAFLPGFEHDVPNRISPDFLVDKKSVKVLAVFRVTESEFYKRIEGSDPSAPCGSAG